MLPDPWCTAEGCQSIDALSYAHVWLFSASLADLRDHLFTSAVLGGFGAYDGVKPGFVADDGKGNACRELTLTPRLQGTEVIF
jgi:hypothetical protein